MHINTKRAGKRNGLKGSVHMAIGILNRVVSAKDVFSDNERTMARVALKYVNDLLEEEPKNYISLRYK